MIKMGTEMSWKIGAMSLIMVWLCAGHCMGQTTPRTIVSRNYFYNKIMNKVAANCEGKNFYTYHAFVTAAEQFSGFGTTGSDAVRKREVAAFLANVMHETGGLCHINERDKQVRCDTKYPQWPCTPGKRYFGRGPLQLTWNYNYGAAGKAIGFNGLKNPEIVAKNALISFKTAYWFWMNNNCHSAIVNGNGFGATIRAINSGECNGKESAKVKSRVNYYRRFCGDFGVDTGHDISC